jgi:hypothetical protein
VAGTALVEFNELTEKAGVDPVEIFRRIPPKFLVYFALLIWANFGMLTLYVLRLAWRSAKCFLGAPSASISVEKQ